MKTWGWLWEIVRGLLIVAVFAGLIIGAFAIAMAEGRGFGFQPSQNTIPTASPSTPVPIGQSTPTPLQGQVLPSNTPVPPTSCPPPMGWLAHTVEQGETLDYFAVLFGLSADELSQANCLLVETLLPGTLIYLPPQAAPTSEQAAATILPGTTITVTRTRVPCGPPAGWVRYTVQTGDTLYALSRAYGVSVYELQIANCLPSANFIIAGQILYVPNVPTRTPTPTVTGTRTPYTPVTPATDTPTKTFTVTPTMTTTITVTNTTTLTVTVTSTPTVVVPSSTPTPTPTDTPTFTPTVTSNVNPFP